jgi:hypothetical protein
MRKPVINWNGTDEEVTAAIAAQHDYTMSLVPQYIVPGKYPTRKELEEEKAWMERSNELQKAFFAERGIDKDQKIDISNEAQTFQFMRVFREWMKVEPQFSDFLEDVIAKRKIQ